MDSENGRYWSRVRYFAALTNPCNLLYSSSALEDAKRIVFQGQSSGKDDDVALRKAKVLVASSVHPETGRLVPMPFRLSAYVPTNMVIVAGMLHASKLARTAPVIFWQCANQTLNVAFNYSNASHRSKDAGISWPGYVSATVTSCALALGLRKLFSKTVSRGTPKPTLLAAAATSVVPFLAVAVSSCTNVAVTRHKELTQGVPVFLHSFDQQQNAISCESATVGSSVKAGLTSVTQTCATRVLAAVPPFLGPALTVALYSRTRLHQRIPGLLHFVNFGSIACFIAAGLPLGLALYPQHALLPISKLPLELQQKANKISPSSTHVCFNRGL